MKHQHIIPKAQDNIKDRLLIFLDTESKSVRKEDNKEFHQFWFCGYEIVKFYKDGSNKVMESGILNSIQEVWELMVSPNSDYWLYAHNWNFDLGIINIDAFVDEYDAKPSLLIVEFAKTMIDLEVNGITIHIRDTMNYFPRSVKQLGEFLGLSKMDFPSTDDPEEKWHTYCLRDVSIIRTFIINFFKFVIENEFGAIGETVASQAFIAFRNRFMTQDILCHDRKRIIEIERKAYHGGRVEAFYVGKIESKIYKLDINSMYPYVMKDNLYPCLLVSDKRNESLENALEKINRGFLIVADCTINLHENFLGLYVKDKFLFPIGTNIRTSMTTPELLYLIQHGGELIEIHQIAYYSSAHIFDDYVSFFYHKRLENRDNKTASELYKLMLNSLYGKFGQRNGEWETVDYDYPFDENYITITGKDGQTSYRRLLGIVQKRNETVENSDHAVVSIAAHVTAYARIFLHKLIKKAGERNVYYVDTDCLFVNEDGYRNLKDDCNPSELGKLKLEGVYDEGVVFGCKDYMLFGYHERITDDGKVEKIIEKVQKTKGVRSNAEKIADNQYQQLKFNKWSSLSVRGTKGEIIIETIQKTLKRNYDKGRVGDDGYVHPFVFDFPY